MCGNLILSVLEMRNLIRHTKCSFMSNVLTTVRLCVCKTSALNKHLNVCIVRAAQCALTLKYRWTALLTRSLKECRDLARSLKLLWDKDNTLKELIPLPVRDATSTRLWTCM